MKTEAVRAGASERKNSNFSGIFNMPVKILLIVAIVIQTIATLFAIRLIRTTKYNSIWIRFTIGFTLLSVERVVQFLRANGVRRCLMRCSSGWDWSFRSVCRSA